MEINIRLAGVQLGPYSEKQIREYLAEGLVSPEDQACADGTENWITVTELMAQLPPAEGEPVVPPAMADAVFEDPEPLEEPKRAPEPAEGVTHLPTRVSDSEPQTVEAMAKRTLMIGPTTPVRRPGKSPTAASTATTTPLSNTGGTKKISRSSIVKGVGSNTAPLPTKPIAPLETSTPAPAPQAPSPATQLPTSAPPIPDGTTMPKKSGMPAILQSLTAKTAPMRSAPPVPPSRSTMPVTAPLPTRPINPPSHLIANPDLPAPDRVVAPPSVVEVITQKMERATPPATEEPAIEATKSKPILEKVSRFSSKKKPAPEPDPSLVPVEDTAAPETPLAAKKKIPGLIFGCACLAVLLAYYVWSPYHTAGAVRDALASGTQTQLNATVDFDAVRASLKDQVKNQLLTASPDPKSAAAAATALDTLNNSIDLYVTPAGISELAGKTESFSKDDLAKAISPDVAATLLQTLSSQPIRSQGLSSITDFVMVTDVAMLHLQFAGLEWKLKRVELRPDLRTPAADGAPSPLIAPVVNTFLARGNDLAKVNDWDGAIREFSQVLAIDPNSSVAYNARAGARESKGDLDGAIKDYTQAITLNPQMADAYNGRGNAKASKNDLEGAIADFTLAVKIDPTLATAYDSRGNAKTAKDDLDGAISDFSQAITINPTLASAFSDRGFARQANGNLDGAISDYTQALALKPHTATAYYNRGLARQSQGNLDAAIIDYDHALAFDPKIAGAYYYRGNAKSALHDVDGAIADFTQAVNLNPKNALAFFNRGLARQSKGDFDGAVADYTQALGIDSKIAPAYYNRGLIRGQTNDPDGAIADASHSLDLDPKNNQAFYTRAYAKLLKGNLDGAQVDFKQYCDLAPHEHYADNSRLYLWLISKAQNSKLDADQDLSDALENSWNSPSDDLVTKTATFLLGRTSEAEYIAGAASTDPNSDRGQHCEAYYFAGMRRLLLGDKAAALDFFHKSLATDQKNFCEYSLAQAELQGLQPPPPTPPISAPALLAPPARIP
jgi:tetratricopeptide (TPR) repeat protein